MSKEVILVASTEQRKINSAIVAREIANIDRSDTFIRDRVLSHCEQRVFDPEDYAAAYNIKLKNPQK